MHGHPSSKSCKSCWYGNTSEMPRLNKRDRSYASSRKNGILSKKGNPYIIDVYYKNIVKRREESQPNPSKNTQTTINNPKFYHQATGLQPPPSPSTESAQRYFCFAKVVYSKLSINTASRT